MRSFLSMSGSLSRRVLRAGATLAALATLGACEFLTGVPPVGSVTITVTPQTIAAQGAPAQVTAQALRPEGGVADHRRVWPTVTSRNTAVATVSTRAGVGTVIGIAPGQSWIVAESDGKTDSVLVTVTAPIPQLIQFDPAFPQVRVGATTQVRVIPIGVGGQPFSTFTLDCQSSNAQVLQAAASGQGCALRGLAIGPATLRVTVNGVANAQVDVQVAAEPITRVEPVIRRTLRETEVVPIQVRAFNAAGTEIPSVGRPFAFSSSDQTVATVDGSGVVTARREGTTTLTVFSENDVRGQVTLQVTRIPVAAVVLQQNVFFRLGAPAVIQPTALDSVNPPRSLSLAGRDVRFRVVDTTVLTIAPSGLVTPRREGQTRIVSTVDGLADSTIATVTRMPVGALFLDSTSVTRFIGQTYQYTFVVRDSLGRTLDPRSVRINWLSSNLNVASVNGATGFVTANAPGAARIRATIDQSDILGRTIAVEGDFLVLQVPAARVNLSQSTLSLRVGQSGVVGITALDSAGNQLFQRPVAVVTNSNPAVAVVTGAGGGAANVNAIGVGSTTITFRALNAAGLPEGQPGELTVTVTAPSATLRAPTSTSTAAPRSAAPSARTGPAARPSP